MRYEVRDTYGDPILVEPANSDGITPQCAVRFTGACAEEDCDDIHVIDMVLSDRQVTDLKQAMNRSIRESRRAG